MEKWKEFENLCYQYLNQNYSSRTTKFIHNGGSDSTQSDIAVWKNGMHSFNIECKMPVAQSGQFVLIDNGNCFSFSKANKSSNDILTSSIIDYMNQYYDKFKEVSTTSIPINFNKNIFTAWIINHYQSMGVKYVITTNDVNMVIFPIEKYGDYFDITATFRKKKSGSRKLSYSAQPEIQQLLNEVYGNCKIQFSGGKVYATLPVRTPEKIKLYGSSYTYQLKQENNGTYLIRMLSNTNNPNVIFSVHSNSSQMKPDLDKFIKDIS